MGKAFLAVSALLLAGSALGLVGCTAEGIGPDYAPAYYPQPQPIPWNGQLNAQDFMQRNDFQAQPRPTWCRPDGYGGVICS